MNNFDFEVIFKFQVCAKLWSINHHMPGKEGGTLVACAYKVASSWTCKRWELHSRHGGMIAKSLAPLACLGKVVGG
jgi:hypothetical protein